MSKKSKLRGQPIPVKPLGVIRDGGLRIVLISWMRRQFANLIVVDSFDRTNWIGWDALNQRLTQTLNFQLFERRYGPDAVAELAVFMRRSIPRAAIPA